MGGTLTLWPGKSRASQYIFCVVYNAGGRNGRSSRGWSFARCWVLRDRAGAVVFRGDGVDLTSGP